MDYQCVEAVIEPTWPHTAWRRDIERAVVVFYDPDTGRELAEITEADLFEAGRVPVWLVRWLFRVPMVAVDGG